MTRPVAPEAGHRIETSMRKGEAFAKLCGSCGCRIDRRKTYCGPCYDVRLMENIAANRHKYRSRKT
jgi:hypothetical protein